MNDGYQRKTKIQGFFIFRKLRRHRRWKRILQRRHRPIRLDRGWPLPSKGRHKEEQYMNAEDRFYSYHFSLFYFLIVEFTY
jgi:hypothetical protein